MVVMKWVHVYTFQQAMHLFWFLLGDFHELPLEMIVTHFEPWKGTWKICFWNTLLTISVMDNDIISLLISAEKDHSCFNSFHCFK